MHVLWICEIHPCILYNVPVLGSDGERQKAEAEDHAQSSAENHGTESNSHIDQIIIRRKIQTGAKTFALAMQNNDVQSSQASCQKLLKTTSLKAGNNVIPSDNKLHPSKAFWCPNMRFNLILHLHCKK